MNLWQKIKSFFGWKPTVEEMLKNHEGPVLIAYPKPKEEIPLKSGEPSAPTQPPKRDGRYNEKLQLIINKAGFELVKHFEGCSLKAYLDSVKVPTIGWGRIVYPDGRKVKMGDTCTQQQADFWLFEDLEKEGARYVRSYVKTPLNENQFSALTSFTYNRGAGRLRELVKIHSDLAKGMLAYNWAGADHKYLEGLDRRRHAEVELFLGRDWRKLDSVAKFRKFVEE